MQTFHQSSLPGAREGYIPVENARLYFREVGQGLPLIILHGGPDFDHSYLLPEMDRLADTFRLIYYDQRGRGKSATHVKAKNVTIESESDDLDRLRQYFQFESFALLGHSWGGLLALEYALRHPRRVSRLILMNTAPASHDDYMLWSRELHHMRATGEDARMKALSASAAFREGEPDAVADYYRIHFKPTLRQPAQLESVVERLRLSFTRKSVLQARAIEARLIDETWLSKAYNLLPKLKRLSIPALVLHGDYDFIPVERVAPIAQAIPGARLVLLRDCGHFSFLECPDQVRQEIGAFLYAI